MIVLRDLGVAISTALDEWRRLAWSELQFVEAPAAVRILAVMLASALLVMLVRGLRPGASGPRRQVVLPALVPMVRRSRLAFSRHAAFLLFALGIPFFAVALADPRTPFTQEEVSYPGRRIAILVDASTSMALKFESKDLQTRGAPAFFTAVAAAERFVRLRMAGPYHDLIGLVEFGTEAYVVTPFTTDYENILLSLQLIGDPKEWGRFDDWGTTIIKGLNVGTQLFKSFDFLNASGNLMLVFSDGRDDQATLRGQQLQDLMSQARKTAIPIYMIRTAYNLEYGKVAQDRLWREAVERTGGRFYAAGDERAIIQAEDDINRLTAGRVDVRQYTSQRPRFTGFTLIAVALWTTAAAMKLGLRRFQTFP